MGNFDYTLLDTKTAIREHIAREQPQAIAAEDLGPPFPAYTINGDLNRVFYLLKESVDSDIKSYVLPPQTPKIQTEEIEGDVKSEEKQDPDTTAEENKETEEQKKEKDAPKVEQATTLAQAGRTMSSPYAAEFASDLVRLRPEPLQDSKLLAPENYSGIPEVMQKLYKLLAREVDDYADNFATAGGMASSLQKMRKAVEVISKNRISEATTLLKSALKDNPNNKYIAFALSQIWYFRAHGGMNDALPRAREVTKRCCSFGDMFADDQLMYYRYLSVATERHFSAERSLEMMRDYYLLNPENMTGPDGLLAHQGWHLRSWVVLATIPMRYWGVYEFDSLLDLVDKVEGGSALYIKFFRKGILQRIREEGESMKKFVALEQNLAKSYSLYESLTEPAHNQFGKDGIAIGGPELPWCISSKYLQIFLTTAPIPSFDEALLHMSLDGRRFANKAYPTKMFKDKTYDYGIYWRCWANSITPDDKMRLRHIIPTVEVEHDSAMWRRFEDLLKVLQHEEQELIDQDKWAKIQPYIQNYNFKTLIEVGMGRANTHKEPDQAFFAQFFHEWSLDTPENPLPSEVILAHARMGGFGSLEEALSVFEGVQRILTHAVHGLEARIKAAWILYEQEHEKDAKPKQAKIGEVGIIAFGIVPISLMLIGIAVISSKTQAQGLMMMLGIVAIAICASILVVIRGMSAQNTQEQKPTRHIHESSSESDDK